MAVIKPLKLNSEGHPEEIDVAADSLEAVSFVVNGGGPVVGATGIDMNGQDISDLSDLVFTDPSVGTINQTAGALIVDNIMAKDRENLMTTAGSVSFPVITNVAGQVDAFRLPALAGTPSATPTTGGEGHLVWDSTNNIPYAWNGTSWQNLALATEALSVQNPWIAEVAVAARDVVFVSSADNVSPAIASADVEARKVVGFAVAAAAAAASVEVQTDGIVSGFSGLTAGAVQYLSSTVAGGIVATPPGAGNSVVKVGIAKSATAVQVLHQYMGKKSA